MATFDMAELANDHTPRSAARKADTSNARVPPLPVTRE